MEYALLLGSAERLFTSSLEEVCPDAQTRFQTVNITLQINKEDHKPFSTEELTTILVGSCSVFGHNGLKCSKSEVAEKTQRPSRLG